MHSAVNIIGIEIPSGTIEAVGTNLAPHEILGSHDTGESSNPYNTTAIYATGENNLVFTSEDAMTPISSASKLTTISYSRKISKRTSPPMSSGQCADNLNSSVKRGKLNSSKAFEFSSSIIPQENVKADADCFKAPDKGSLLGSKEKQSGTLSEKRKTTTLSGSLKVHKIGANTKAHIPEHPVMESRTEGVGLDFSGSEPVDGSTRRSLCKSNETTALDLVRKSPSISAMKSSSSTWKSVKCCSPIIKAIASEIMQEENTEAVQTYTKGLKSATLSSKPIRKVEVLV